MIRPNKTKLFFFQKHLLCFIGIVTVHGSYVNDISHNVPSARTISQTQTIHGGAIGGNPSAGAFSSAYFSQRVAVPSRVHPVTSTSYSGNTPGVLGSFQSQNFQGSQNSQGYNQGYQNVGQGSAIGVSNVSFDPGQVQFQRQNYNNQETSYNNQGGGYNNYVQSYNGQGTSQYYSNPSHTAAQNIGNQNYISQRTGVDSQRSFTPNNGGQYRSVSMVQSRYYSWNYMDFSSFYLEFDNDPGMNCKQPNK